MKPLLEIADNEPSTIQNLVMKEANKRKVDCEITHLSVGDFVWDNEICIERKTVPDYIGSVKDGRIFSQAADMAQYRKAYIIVTGSFKGIESDPQLKTFKVAHKLGSMASLLARSEVKLWQVDNRAQFVLSLFILKEKSDKGEKSFIVERHSKTISRKDPNMALFLTIPGVGPAMAKRIKEDYETFYELIEDVKKGRKLHTNMPKEGMIFLKKVTRVR